MTNHYLDHYKARLYATGLRDRNEMAFYTLGSLTIEIQEATQENEYTRIRERVIKSQAIVKALWDVLGELSPTPAAADENDNVTDDDSAGSEPEPITILDYVRSKVGDKETYSGEDHYNNGVDILGGCCGCHATLGSYNAYPTKHGYWTCRECVGTAGFATVEEFDQWQPIEYVDYDD